MATTTSNDIATLRKQAEDIINKPFTARRGLTLTQFKANAKAILPSIAWASGRDTFALAAQAVIQESQRCTDAEAPQSASNPSLPSTTWRKLLIELCLSEMGDGDSVTVTDGGAMTVDEDGMTTIGEVISTLLPNINICPQLTDYAHDLIIHFSHGGITLTRPNLLEEFRLKEALIDGSIEMKKRVIKFRLTCGVSSAYLFFFNLALMMQQSESTEGSAGVGGWVATQNPRLQASQHTDHQAATESPFAHKLQQWVESSPGILDRWNELLLAAKAIKPVWENFTTVQETLVPLVDEASIFSLERELRLTNSF